MKKNDYPAFWLNGSSNSFSIFYFYAQHFTVLRIYVESETVESSFFWKTVSDLFRWEDKQVWCLYALSPFVSIGRVISHLTIKWPKDESTLLKQIL